MTLHRVAASRVRLKRVYEPPSPEDGVRVLVDRLWPRGLSKADASVDRWMKEIAPSAELRKWFSHDPQRWPDFRRRYIEELRRQDTALDELCELARHNTVTLVFGARDEQHNDGVVLREVLLRA